MNQDIKLVRTPHSGESFQELDDRFDKELGELYKLPQQGRIPHQVATMFDCMWRVLDRYTHEIERLQTEINENRVEINELQARLDDIEQE